MGQPRSQGSLYSFVKEILSREREREGTLGTRLKTESVWNDMTLNHLRATKSVEAVESMNEQARRFF